MHALVSVWEQFCVSIAQQSWSCACRGTVGFVALFRHIIVITRFLSCVGIFCVYSLNFIVSQLCVADLSLNVTN